MISRLSAAALLSVVLAGCGGTEVKGIVRDEDSGQPLQGATVRVGNESTHTDNGGFYNLEVDIEDDTAQVMVGAPGYEPKSMLATFNEDQEIVYSDIELKKQFNEAEFKKQQMQTEVERSQLQRQQQELLNQQKELNDLRKQQQQQQEQLQEQHEQGAVDRAVEEEREKKIEEQGPKAEESTTPERSTTPDQQEFDNTGE